MTVKVQEILLPTENKNMFGSAQQIANSDIHSGSELHFVSGRPIVAPYADQSKQLEHNLDLEEAVFGLGCFWGAERVFWETEGVYSTAVGYAAGHAANPTYEKVCTGSTGHAEVVLVVFDRNQISFEQLLKVFFESHNPTQGMRQGNDIGSQYRSGIYCVTEQQLDTAKQVTKAYQVALTKDGFPSITTDLEMLSRFNYAEDYHQQYLAKNPAGYCGIDGTGVSCPL